MVYWTFMSIPAQALPCNGDVQECGMWKWRMRRNHTRSLCWMWFENTPTIRSTSTLSMMDFEICNDLCNVIYHKGWNYPHDIVVMVWFLGHVFNISTCKSCVFTSAFAVSERWIWGIPQTSGPSVSKSLQERVRPESQVAKHRWLWWCVSWDRSLVLT